MNVSGHQNSRRRNNRPMLNRIDLLRTFGAMAA